MALRMINTDNEALRTIEIRERQQKRDKFIRIMNTRVRAAVKHLRDAKKLGETGRYSEVYTTDEVEFIYRGLQRELNQFRDAMIHGFTAEGIELKR